MWPGRLTIGEGMSPSGRPCWRGTGEGSGGDYGYSGSIPAVSVRRLMLQRLASI
jgi:hypothetical protein